MAYYEPQDWQAPARQPSWEQQPPPSRSGATSSSEREDSAAFATQFEEVDRVIDNLLKSGKLYLSGSRGPPVMGGPRFYGEYNSPRMHPGRHSVSNSHSRSHSGANLQNFYASQRQSRGPQNEAEQMMQAKRRVAAQRERELRNYHQEQQYNRSVLADMASNKSDRSMSPSALSEEGRRELIARQHRALYGDNTGGFMPGFNVDESGQPTSAGPRGASPQEGDTKSPTGAPGFPSFDPAQKPPTPPTEESAHSRQISKSTTAPASGMAPIGSRPGQQPNKRTTSPLPGSLSFGFSGNENERAGSSNSNTEQKNNQSIGTWGTGSGVWGSNKIGQSVWG